EREEGLPIVGVLEVQRRAALSAQPYTRARQVRERIAAGWFDACDAGAVIGEQHAGHRPRDAPREVEDVDVPKDPRLSHRRPPRSWAHDLPTASVASAMDTPTARAPCFARSRAGVMCVRHAYIGGRRCKLRRVRSKCCRGTKMRTRTVATASS